MEAEVQAQGAWSRHSSPQDYCYSTGSSPPILAPQRSPQPSRNQTSRTKNATRLSQPQVLPSAGPRHTQVFPPSERLPHESLQQMLVPSWRNTLHSSSKGTQFAVQTSFSREHKLQCFHGNDPSCRVCRPLLMTSARQYPNARVRWNTDTIKDVNVFIFLRYYTLRSYLKENRLKFNTCRPMLVYDSLFWNCQFICNEVRFSSPFYLGRWLLSHCTVRYLPMLRHTFAIVKFF